MRKLWLSLIVLVAFLTLFAVNPALAQDPVTTDVVTEADSGGGNWLTSLLGNETLFGAIISGVLLLWGFLKAKLHLKDTKWGKVLEVVEQAVSEVYMEFIREIKAKSGGSRKLTVEEIKEARDLAWKKALSIGKTKGLDIAKLVAADYFPVLIEKILGKISK